MLNLVNKQVPRGLSWWKVEHFGRSWWDVNVGRRVEWPVMSRCSGRETRSTARDESDGESFPEKMLYSRSWWLVSCRLTACRCSWLHSFNATRSTFPMFGICFTFSSVSLTLSPGNGWNLVWFCTPLALWLILHKIWMSKEKLCVILRWQGLVHFAIEFFFSTWKLYTCQWGLSSRKIRHGSFVF